MVRMAASPSGSGISKNWVAELATLAISTPLIKIFRRTAKPIQPVFRVTEIFIKYSLNIFSIIIIARSLEIVKIQEGVW